MIGILYMQKKLYHYTESGIDKVDLSGKGGPAIREGLQYINNYCTNNGFKVVNVDKEDMMYHVFISKE